MSLRIFGCILSVCLIFSACRKEPDAVEPASKPPPAPVTLDAPASNGTDPAPPPPEVPSGAEVVQGGKIDLVALNKIFKSYCATLDNGRPKSLGELVAAGYMEKLPEPPKGKRLAIDYKKMEVVLENE